MVGWPIRATGWPCKIFVLQNSWESFVIMERVRKSVAWRWKCLKQLTFELYWRRHWVPNTNIKCSHHWSKHITIRWKSRDKERYSKNIFEHNMLRYRIYPFELRCDIKRSIDSQTNNVEEPTDTKWMSRQQISRPTRNAPGIAGFLRISDVIQDVNETIPVEWFERHCKVYKE